jgi:hypothetical protein
MGQFSVEKPVAPGSVLSGNQQLAKAIKMLRATEGRRSANWRKRWAHHLPVLTGLRKRGYTLTLDRFDAERGSAYRIVLDANATQEETAPTAVEPPIVSATCFAK